MSPARIAGIAVCLGAIGLLIGGVTEVFAVTRSVLITAAACLLAIGFCIALERRWAVVVGRVALWLLVVAAALMFIPDREEAVRTGDPGLQWQFAVLAGYLLLCIALVGRVRFAPKSDPSTAPSA